MQKMSLGVKTLNVACGCGKCLFSASLAFCLLGVEARGQVGTSRPVPADLSALDLVFEQKEGDGGGLSVGCVSGSVCVSGRKREEKR